MTAGQASSLLCLRNHLRSSTGIHPQPPTPQAGTITEPRWGLNKAPLQHPAQRSTDKNQSLQVGLVLLPTLGGNNRFTVLLPLYWKVKN